MKPRYNQNRVCIRGYVTEDVDIALRRVARARGRSLSEHIKVLANRSVNEFNKHNDNVVQMSLFEKG